MRTYNFSAPPITSLANGFAARSISMPTKREVPSLPSIPNDAKLVSRKEADEYLRSRLPFGLSTATWHKYRTSGKLVDGIHYHKLRNGRVGFYLPNLEAEMRLPNQGAVVTTL